MALITWTASQFGVNVVFADEGRDMQAKKYMPHMPYF